MGDKGIRPLISVICPVYNAEDYLQHTLECIKNQTYKELEILLIDDGSIDNSLEICLLEAKKDGRIKVIHTHNNGVASARNLGLSKDCRKSQVNMFRSLIAMI